MLIVSFILVIGLIAIYMVAFRMARNQIYIELNNASAEIIGDETLFIEEAKNVNAIVITIQKEVALRLVAKPKTSDYGAITVSVDAVSDGEIIEYIGREKFYPAPNVDSAVVKLTMNRNKHQNLNLPKFKELVKCAFTMRRKTLVNNLIKGYSMPRENAENLLISCGFDVGVRGEELSTEDFIKLSNSI